MKKLFLVLVVLVVGVGAYFLLKGQSSPVAPTSSMPAGDTGVSEKTVTQVVETPEDASMKKEEAKKFTLDSFEFGYDQKTLTVKTGDTVTITLTNSGKMLHDWVVDEFNAKTKQITAGQTDTVTFVADKAGTYEYYCSVGKHRQNGMVGKLIVE